MSKVLEVVKDVLTIAVVIMLLVYVIKYRHCINELIELRRENFILKKYFYQDYRSNSVNNDDIIYVI